MKTAATVIVFVLLAASALVEYAFGDCPGCARCGCCQVQTRCRVVCNMKTQVTIEHTMKCEELCVLGPSKCCGTKCVPDCWAWFGFRREAVQQPCRCCLTRTVRIPLRMPVEEQVPTYTCVAETVCRGCGNCCTTKIADPAQTQIAVEQARSQGILPTADRHDVLLVLDPANTPTAR